MVQAEEAMRSSQQMREDMSLSRAQVSEQVTVPRTVRYLLRSEDKDAEAVDLLFYFALLLDLIHFQQSDWQGLLSVFGFLNC